MIEDALNAGDGDVPVQGRDVGGFVSLSVLLLRHLYDVLSCSGRAQAYGPVATGGYDLELTDSLPDRCALPDPAVTSVLGQHMRADSPSVAPDDLAREVEIDRHFECCRQLPVRRQLIRRLVSLQFLQRPVAQFLVVSVSAQHEAPPKGRGERCGVVQDSELKLLQSLNVGRRHGIQSALPH
ncbi:hypothetical protein HY68_36330 [Streptomyces sp. AcH 505]|nr:hypothetical protein HY68_36330 [Streptomyces sp. AcH 505]